MRVPVASPSTPEEFHDYLVYWIKMEGLNFLDSDMYLDAESEFACEVDFTLEEYDDEAEDGRWNEYFKYVMRSVWFGLADEFMTKGRSTL